MHMPDVRLHEPASLKNACDLLRQYADRARVLAGGTDILVDLRQNSVTGVDQLVSLRRIPGLNDIEETADGFRIGAMVTPLLVALVPNYLGNLLRELEEARRDAQAVGPRTPEDHVSDRRRAALAVDDRGQQPARRFRVVKRRGAEREVGVRPDLRCLALEQVECFIARHGGALVRFRAVLRAHPLGLRQHPLGEVFRCHVGREREHHDHMQEGGERVDRVGRHALHVDHAVRESRRDGLPFHVVALHVLPTR